MPRDGAARGTPYVGTLEVGQGMANRLPGEPATVSPWGQGMAPWAVTCEAGMGPADDPTKDPNDPRTSIQVSPTKGNRTPYPW